MRRRVRIRGATWGALALAVLLAAPAVEAQTTGATLEGRVLSDDGGPLAGATLTLTNPETGLTRTETSAADGTFRFPAVPVGAWDLEVALSGYQTFTQKALELNVATTRTLEVRMLVFGGEERVSVTASPSLIQTGPAVGTVVTDTELETLPLNGRQFANLAALAPGTQLAYNADPTKPDQLTIALNGGIGRNVNYVVDGGDNTDDTIGGALQNYSLEGVEEFTVQTQQYKAEYGRSTGGVLSVVTKTGTNEFGGSVFGFFRNESLNSRTESERLAGADKADYGREQFGVSLGGPIVRDKAHYFVTAERTQRDTNYIVNTGIFTDLDGTAVALPFRDTLVTAKVTVNVDPRQFVQLRYGYQKNTGKYGAGPLYTPSALGTLQNEYHSFLAGHQWVLPGGRMNEFIFQYSQFDNAITADSRDPALYFPSGVASGQNFNTPQTTEQVKWQFKDDFSFGRTIAGSRHDFKVGFNYIHEPTLGGDFSTGVDAPRYTFLDDSLDAPIVRIEQNGGRFFDETPVDQYSVYFQDDWRVNPRLTLNLGLRYDLWTGFDLDQRSNPIWQHLSTQTTYNEPYLLDFRNGGGGVLEEDKDNFGPRLGFSYDLSGEAKTYLRGGFGIYYDFPYTNATILFPAGAVQSNYGVIYLHENPAGIQNEDGSQFQVGDPLPANQLTGLSVGAPREIASPTLRTPYSRQYSVGISHQLTDTIGVNVEATMIDYRDIPFRFRFNAIDPATGERRFPFADSIRLWYGDGWADYKGLNVGLRARISDKLEAQGFYTLSEIEGNVLAGADEFRISDRQYQPGFPRDQVVDALDPLCGACVGPLNTDARHKVTLAATYLAPWDIRLAGMFRYRSATPYTRFLGSDADGDGFDTDLAPGVAHVNDARGDSFSQLDVRGSKTFRFTGDTALEVILDVFNVLNEENPAGFTAAGVPTTFAGDPLQGEQRLAQFGLRFVF